MPFIHAYEKAILMTSVLYLRLYKCYQYTMLTNQYNHAILACKITMFIEMKIFLMLRVHSPIVSFRLLIHWADLQSWSVVIIVFAHVVCTSVRPHFSKSSKTKQIIRKKYSLLARLWVWPRGSLMTPVSCLVRTNFAFPCFA